MKFDEQSSKGIQEILSPLKLAVKRYWGIAWAPALAIAMLVGILSIRLPDYYVTDVLIFIQPQKIATDVVSEPDKGEGEERLEALIQEILSRPRLRAVIDKFGLYPEHSGIVGREKALKLFRKSIDLKPVQSFSGKELVQTFQIKFAHESPKTAFEVTKELSDLFIEESILSTRQETQGTVEFLESQLRTARKRLEVTEAKVRDFVRQNQNRLPEYLDSAIRRLQSARQQFASNSQMITANTSRKGYLQRELRMTASETTVTSGSGPIDTSDPRSALAQYERLLGVIKSKYSDKHPEVVATKQRIAVLRKQVKAGGKTGTAAISESGGREVRTLRREISELEVQTDGFRKENESLKEKIAKLETDINAMPIKEQELIAIRRDYNNVQKNYERLLAAREKSALMFNIVRSQNGTQFKIINPASLPVIPAGPHRLIIAGVGFLVAILLFFGIPIALHILNDSFKVREDLEGELDVDVLGIIPPMKTPASKAMEMRANSTAMMASMLAFVGGGILIFIVV